jgi:hypothetical protein
MEVHEGIYTWGMESVHHTLQILQKRHGTFVSIPSTMQQYQHLNLITALHVSAYSAFISDALTFRGTAVPFALLQIVFPYLHCF